MLVGAWAVVMSLVFTVTTNFQRNATLSLAKSQNEDMGAKRILEKELRSLPVLKSTVGGMYHMESKAKLTLLNTITQGLSTTLLSFR